MFKKLLLILCIGTISFSFSDALKGPYLLFEGEQGVMTVLWQTTDAKTYTIRWGKTPRYEYWRKRKTHYSSESGTYQYKCKFTGLSPATKYYYSVDGVGSGSFVTAPSSSAQSVKILAYGDTRTQPDKHNLVADRMTKTYGSDPAYQTMALLSGDLINWGDWEPHWQDEFFPRNQPGIMKFQSEVPIVAAIGNHEGDGGLFKKYYPYKDMQNQFYWSFDYGPVHVVILDVKDEWIGPNNAQTRWLQSDLNNNDKEWTVVVFHSPGWSAGVMGAHDNNVAYVQVILQPIFEEYGVDVILNGHNHFYSRCDINGVQHITTGGGGAPLNEITHPKSYVNAYERDHHFLEMDVQPNDMHITVKRAHDGSVIEAFSIDQNNKVKMKQDPTFLLLNR